MEHLRFGIAICLAGLVAAGMGCGGGSSGGTTPAEGNDPPTAPEPPEEPQCASYENTFDAIQEVVFERHGCTSDACHGSAVSGGLDLRAGASLASLLNVDSTGSPYPRLVPKRATDSYLFHKLAAATGVGDWDITGSPMPVGLPALSPEQLEGLRLWIDAGAPATGSVGNPAGGGSESVADLLGVCLPPASPIEVQPLEIPPAEEGVQFAMPPYAIPAGTEHENCFAVYYDYRDRIPARFLDETGEWFYARTSEQLADPNTHHLVLIHSGLPDELVDDPSYGAWTCVGGDRDGESCDPVDELGCGDGMCRSEIQDGVACIGFGPPGNNTAGTPGERLSNPDPELPGFFRKIPTHGILYWNSHAFNLTTQDAMHHAWMNFYFAEDRRFQAIGFQDSSNIYAAAGTPPFEKKTYCRNYVLEQGAQLLYLISHTHKRGELFWANLPDGARVYESPFYEDPTFELFYPPLVFDSPSVSDRTIEFCATYNNGVAADGSPDPETVTRLSRKPTRSSCKPVACAEGKIGAPCNGADDDATCDTEPGAGDGMCDACPITAGVTTDDEMFILLGGTLEVVSE
ncbi:MAG: hypothetical protein FJ144_20765 [Deltaproteobacteria bacterium]|nr:hypothetical protein [Deltaproteobacteria bacterium]